MDGALGRSFAPSAAWFLFRAERRRVLSMWLLNPLKSYNHNQIITKLSNHLLGTVPL